MSKTGANEPCPCGSGKKFKKCCRDRITARTYSREDRAAAFAKLDAFIEDVLAEEEAEAHDELWDRWLDRAGELSEELTRMSNDVLDMWFAFDREGDDGAPCAVDRFLAEADPTTAERAFLTSMRQSSMRLYEVLDAIPGVRIRLRDLIEGGEVTVHERTASRTVNRHDCIAARVVPRGPSGGPEIEAGVLPIARMLRDQLTEHVRQLRTSFMRERPGASIDDFYKTLPPIFHDVWVGSILEPSVPELRNGDGEALVITRVRFDVVDRDALAAALDGASRIERGEGAGVWRWSREDGKPMPLGLIRLEGGELTLEASTVSSGAEGRSLVESLAGSAVRHKITTHEDMRRAVQDALRADLLSGQTSSAGGNGEGNERTERKEPDIPADVKEMLVLGHMARHYRAWIDEPVPALDGKTPRAAAKDPALRERVVDLVAGLEGMYQRALRDGEPAYDPSWMWGELGLVDREELTSPPPLAHERVARAVNGSGELSRAVSERLRKEAGFDDRRTVVSESALEVDLEVQRFLRAGDGAANESGADRSAARPYLRLMLNFDLHRRKVFWVDEALAYMLGHTELDVIGSELRAPFASFAVVFTDRHVLSLGERLLAGERGGAGQKSTLAGQILRVVTVYVTEERRSDEERILDVTFALDALGTDLPELVRHRIPIAEDGPVQRYLDEIAPLPAIDDAGAALPDVSPTRGLLRATLNAILYATSTGVEPERRAPGPDAARSKRRDPRGGGGPRVFTSDEVFFLPGTIDVTQVRRMQELERAPQGRTILRRFMVRGHWRRPQRGWADQRLRWIAPYWKGPDMAAVIERAYRLKP